MSIAIEEQVGKFKQKLIQANSFIGMFSNDEALVNRWVYFLGTGD
jgi:hypothetical protein